MQAAFLMTSAARSLRRIMPAVSSTIAVAPPKAPSTGASGGLATATVELPDMSIPGISAGILTVGTGVGELPDMSIPGISAGILAGLVAGGLSDPTRAGTTAALIVAANDSCCEVSINDPATVIAATVAPTEATRIRRRRRGSPVGGLRQVSSLRSPIMRIVMSPTFAVS